MTEIPMTESVKAWETARRWPCGHVTLIAIPTLEERSAITFLEDGADSVLTACPICERERALDSDLALANEALQRASTENGVLTQQAMRLEGQLQARAASDHRVDRLVGLTERLLAIVENQVL